jgi:hypothetical protein
MGRGIKIEKVPMKRQGKSKRENKRGKSTEPIGKDGKSCSQSTFRIEAHHIDDAKGITTRSSWKAE